MKVEIFRWAEGWKFSVILGGLEIESNLYTTRRACVRGLWRWWWKVRDELYITERPHVNERIKQAIQKSGGK